MASRGEILRKERSFDEHAWKATVQKAFKCEYTLKAEESKDKHKQTGKKCAKSLKKNLITRKKPNIF